MSSTTTTTNGTSGKSVLLVGHDPVLLHSILYLIQHADVKEVTILDDDAQAVTNLEQQIELKNSSVNITILIEDPLALIKRDEAFVLSFSLVVTNNVARPIEETLGEILYKAPPRALIISRSSAFNVKMRSQYKEHRNAEEPDSPIIYGIDLHPHPESNSESKAERLLSGLSTYDLSSTTLRQFLLLVAATAKVFKEKNGFAPGHKPSTGDLSDLEGEVVEVAKELNSGLKLNESDLKTCCEQGYSALPMTSEIIGTLIGAEGTMLMLQRGKPINNALLQWTAGAVLGIEVEG